MTPNELTNALERLELRYYDLQLRVEINNVRAAQTKRRLDRLRDDIQTLHDLARAATSLPKLPAPPASASETEAPGRTHGPEPRTSQMPP